MTAILLLIIAALVWNAIEIGQKLMDDENLT
jgi:hypothetical protein